VFSETELSHVHFKVVLKNDVEHRKAWLDSDASRFVGEMLFKTLSDHERRFINYAAEHGKISVTDAVRITKKDWGDCKELLMGLCTKGILKHVHRPVARDPKAHFKLASAK
jgi:ATP-dependent DNA helicase RecG